MAAVQPQVRKLTRLQINEVSAVDRGAGEGVRVMLRKRANEAYEALHLREYTAEQRRAMARTGEAMEGGEYPIKGRKDLKNAIRAIGRAKKPARTRAHIMRRARSLGMTDLLPDSWVGKRFAKSELRKGGNMPGKGKYPYGKTKYADPGYQKDKQKRYPIDTERHIRAAWNYIHKTKNAGEYTSGQLSKIKSRIISAWKKHIDSKGPPEATTKKAAKKDLRYLADFFAKSEGGEDFATELAELKDTTFGEGLWNAVHESGHAFKHSIESIMDDDAITDKGQAIRQSFSQYLQHLATLVPDGDVAKIAKRALSKLQENDMAKKGPIDVSPKENPPVKPATSVGSGSDPKRTPPPGVEEETDPEVKKSKVWKRRYNALVDILKSDKKTAEWMMHGDNDMDDQDVKKLLKMSVKKRAKFIKANPPGALMQKRLDALPESVRKGIEEGQKAAADLRKREEAETVAAMAKRAADLAMPAPVAKEAVPHLVELRKQAPEAFDAVMGAFDQVIKSLNAQSNTGIVYAEFGHSRPLGAEGGGASGYDQLLAKAKAYREDQEKLGKSVTEAQAFEKVYTDPSNKDLVALSKREGSVAA